jgi:hypothetical protein
MKKSRSGNEVRGADAVGGVQAINEVTPHPHDQQNVGPRPRMVKSCDKWPAAAGLATAKAHERKDGRVAIPKAGEYPSPRRAGCPRSDPRVTLPRFVIGQFDQEDEKIHPAHRRPLPQ